MMQVAQAYFLSLMRTIVGCRRRADGRVARKNTRGGLYEWHPCVWRGRVNGEEDEGIKEVLIKGDEG